METGFGTSVLEGEAAVEWVEAGWWSYPLLAATIAGSAALPPVPSESAMVTAMSLAFAGKLDVVLVAVASAAGSGGGDLLAYLIGRAVAHRARRRAGRSARGQAALRWVGEQGQKWGPGLIVAGRFIPGGTTAVGVSAGILSYPLTRFAVFAAIGAVLWSGFGVALALLGRAAFPHSIWAGTVAALVLVFAFSAAVHLWRRSSARRRRGFDDSAARTE